MLIKKYFEFLLSEFLLNEYFNYLNFYHFSTLLIKWSIFNRLNANPIKWSDTLKQFVRILFATEVFFYIK